MGDGDDTVVESWDGPGVEALVEEDVGCFVSVGGGLVVCARDGPGDDAQFGETVGCSVIN